MEFFEDSLKTVHFSSLILLAFSGPYTVRVPYVAYVESVGSFINQGLKVIFLLTLRGFFFITFPRRICIESYYSRVEIVRGKILKRDSGGL